MTTQHYQHPTLGTVSFMDYREQVHSALCQPWDIVPIRFDLTAAQLLELKREIAVDIRIGCGMPVAKATKNLKFN